MKKRFTEAQIVGFLREADAGIPLKDLCRKHGLSGSSSSSRSRPLESLISLSVTRLGRIHRIAKAQDLQCRKWRECTALKRPNLSRQAYTAVQLHRATRRRLIARAIFGKHRFHE